MRTFPATVLPLAAAGALLLPQQALAAAPTWKNLASQAFSATPGNLVAVAAVSRTAVIAVNQSGRPFHWNGSSWTVRKGAGAFTPTSLTASSAKSAWAV